MKERPILFSGLMVRAILKGMKTQTRRVIKPQPDLSLVGGDEYPSWKVDDAWQSGFVDVKCPFGEVGDRLWVRETWCAGPKFNSVNPSSIPSGSDVWYRAHADDNISKWIPSIFMPRWASRITLEITGVRVERLQDITPDDCRSEGHPVSNMNYTQECHDDAARDWFMDLWDSINGKDETKNWNANPWVWVIEFERIEK
jgi:hypothetical protein